MQREYTTLLMVSTFDETTVMMTGGMIELRVFRL